MKPQFMKFKLPVDFLTRPEFQNPDRVVAFLKILDWMSLEPRQRLYSGEIVEIPALTILGPSRLLSQELDIERNLLRLTTSLLTTFKPLETKVKPFEIAATLRNPLEFSIEVKEVQPKLNQTSSMYCISIIYKELELIYLSLYPRKEGKTPGLKKLVKEIKDQKGLDDFRKAVTNYKNLTVSKNTEQQFILHFHTFAGRWRDFLDLNVPAKPKTQIKTAGDILNEY